MNDKDKIIESLLKSKIEIIADRNERFAMIQDDLQYLRSILLNKIDVLGYKISTLNKEEDGR